MSKKGMLIYGVCIGLLTVVIRLFGAYPEGMSLSLIHILIRVETVHIYYHQMRRGDEILTATAGECAARGHIRKQ